MDSSETWTSALLNWYTSNARKMPWRGHPDPYAVWVSEIMLQQTRVETVRPDFERWMQRFPTVRDLAAANLQEVLNLWEGLGYYSRARNLHRAAQRVVRDWQGDLPQDVRSLRSLPGIGPYTAGAIASLAFNQDEPVVDGNVARVLARLFNLEEPVDSATGKKLLWRIAAENLPAGRAAAYNQALMELGALICLPRKPQCAACPLRVHCAAFDRGVQDSLPVRKPRGRTPHYTVTAAVIRRNGRVLIAQRPQDGLLGGLWEFPGGKLEAGESLASCLQREIGEELGVAIQVGEKMGVYQHAYTHFKVTLHAFACTLIDEQEPQALEAADLRWVAAGDLAGFPMGKIDRQIAQQVIQFEAN